MDATSTAHVCGVCFRHCCLQPGQVGFCRARVGGPDAVVPESFGRLTSVAMDPIEKKPLAFFRPGTKVLSVGSYGCNMRCPFCQNASIAQVGEKGASWRAYQPQDLVDMALDCADIRCIGIAYTYNEPFTFLEFMRDCAQLAHENGLANVVVSNGMVAPDALATVSPYLDAANIDLKCFTEEGYRKLGGDLETAKATITALSQQGCHVEATTLVVPGFNDNDEEIDALAAWLASVDPATPLHLTRFFPRYKMHDARPTPLSTLTRLQAVAKRHLKRVVLGNV